MTHNKFVVLLLMGLVVSGFLEGGANGLRFPRSAGYKGMAHVGGKRADDGTLMEGDPDYVKEPEDEAEEFVTRENVCGHNYVWSMLEWKCVPLNWGIVMPKRARSSWTNQNKGNKGFSIGRALGK